MWMTLVRHVRACIARTNSTNLVYVCVWKRHRYRTFKTGAIFKTKHDTNILFLENSIYYTFEISYSISSVARQALLDWASQLFVWSFTEPILITEKITTHDCSTGNIKDFALIIVTRDKSFFLILVLNPCSIDRIIIFWCKSCQSTCWFLFFAQSILSITVLTWDCSTSPVELVAKFSQSYFSVWHQQTWHRHEDVSDLISDLKADNSQ